MSNIRSYNTFPDPSQQSLESKLDLYKETITVLQSANAKLTKENQSLLEELDTKTKEILRLQQEKSRSHPSSAASSFVESKSNLMEIIESFQEHNRQSIEELQFEFDDIEKIQTGMKAENIELKKSLQKFEELYPSMYKISNLTQQLFRGIQNYVRGEPVSFSFLVSSPERKYKTVSLVEHFRQDINKTKEVLEKIIEMLADYYAEKIGSGSCQLF
jgi:DNA repair exonuclease SbcCD ATPase subunit